MIFRFRAFNFSLIARCQFVDNDQILTISLHLLYRFNDRACGESAASNIGYILEDLNKFAYEFPLCEAHFRACFCHFHPFPVSSLISYDLSWRFSR